MKFLLTIGILFILLSIKVFVTGNFSDFIYGPEMSLGKSKNIFSILFLLVGLYSLFMAYKSYKHQKIHGKYIDHSICPTCKESYNYIDLKEGLCPYCDIKTVDIKEYYKDNKDDES